MENIASIDNYTPDQIQVSKLAKIIAHPARIAILDLLSRKSCTCNNIVETLPLAQSTVSQHLKELKNVGLIQGTIEGVKMNYCLNPARINQVTDTLNNFFYKIKSETVNCKI